MDEPKPDKRNPEPGSGSSDPRNDGYMMVGMGNAYVQRNQLPEARVTFKKVLESFPADTEPAQLARQNLEKLPSESS